MVIEGEVRSKDLSDYLDKMGSPKIVWLSEDGTGIVSRVEYDSSTNQLVGLVLPLNDKTGIPIPYSFPADSQENIEAFMKKEKSKIVYIVMAQPLKEGIPPFLLQIFGTNNKFSADSVTRRHKFTIAELKRYETLF